MDDDNSQRWSPEKQGHQDIYNLVDTILPEHMNNAESNAESLEELYEQRQRLLRQLGLSDDVSAADKRDPTFVNPSFDDFAQAIASEEAAVTEHSTTLASAESYGIESRDVKSQNSLNERKRKRSTCHVEVEECPAKSTKMLPSSSDDQQAAPVSSTGMTAEPFLNVLASETEYDAVIVDPSAANVPAASSDTKNVEETAGVLTRRRFKRGRFLRASAVTGDADEKDLLVRRKIVMKQYAVDLFDVLPDGWIEVTHSSGMPIYLHKPTRVCTFSRPYFIGPGSLRNHQVPVSAVPCLHYTRARQQHEDTAVKTEANASSHATANTAENEEDALSLLKTSAAKVQTFEDYKLRQMSAVELREYCSKKFDFDTIELVRFKSWSQHRSAQKRREASPDSNLEDDDETTVQDQVRGSVNEDIGRPALPTDVRLITVDDKRSASKAKSRKFFINPLGKSSITVLHEYVQKVLKGKVSYEFGETRNASKPYLVKIKVNTPQRLPAAAADAAESDSSWVVVGRGSGNSKKTAKLEAACDALRVLVPGLHFDKNGIASSETAVASPAVAGEESASGESQACDLFDLIAVVDARVCELSMKAGQPPPFVILQECLKRHAAFGETKIDVKIERLKHQRHELTMRVGKHEVRVVCTNKKEGKQRAAQHMLARLQPGAKSWGALLRLYGYGAQLQLRDSRRHQDDVVRLQTQGGAAEAASVDTDKPDAHHLEPNLAVLAKLRHEMAKMYRQRQNDTQLLQHIQSPIKIIDI